MTRKNPLIILYETEFTGIYIGGGVAL